MSPKVSVIIPVHNTEKYLRQCLDSVCCQTLKEIEIICINDCSTDESPQILREYAEKDRRIAIIDFEQNRGVSAARNAGIEETSGDYIGFVDSDDRIAPDFLEKLFSAASDETDIVKGETRRFKDNKVSFNCFVSFLDNIHKIRENAGNFLLFFFSAIYRKNFIDNYGIRFYENIQYGEDLSFCAKAVACADSVKCVDDVFYYYVDSESSTMNHVGIDSFAFFYSDLKAVDYMIKDIGSGNVDWCVYDVQFEQILTHVLMNMSYFTFSDDFKKEWVNFILKKYRGKSDRHYILRRARLNCRDLERKCQLSFVRQHMEHRRSLCAK